jgi:transposase
MANKRTYPRELELEAVALAKKSDKSISELERELGIRAGLLAKWKSWMKTDGEQAFPGKGRLKEDDELIRRARTDRVVVSPARHPDEDAWCCTTHNGSVAKVGGLRKEAA